MGKSWRRNWRLPGPFLLATTWHCEFAYLYLLPLSLSLQRPLLGFPRDAFWSQTPSPRLCALQERSMKETHPIGYFCSGTHGRVQFQRKEVASALSISRGNRDSSTSFCYPEQTSTRPRHHRLCGDSSQHVKTCPPGHPTRHQIRPMRLMLS